MAKESALKAVTKIRTDSTPVVIKNLAKWLREELYLVTDEEGKARFESVVVRQLVKGNKRGEEVFSVAVSKKANDDWADNAAMEIYGKLQTETATLGGLQKYALYAYHSNDNENHTSRFVLKIQGTSDEDDGEALDSEGTSKDGQIAQHMRHTEVFAKLLSGSQMVLVQAYQNIVGRQTEMLEKLMADKLATIELIQEMSDTKGERDINMVKAKAKADGIANLLGKLGVLLPAMANRVVGKPIFPVQDSSVSMMTKSLMTSLAANEDRLKKFVEVMTPEETVAFMNILETVSAKLDDNGMPIKKEEE